MTTFKLVLNYTLFLAGIMLLAPGLAAQTVKTTAGGFVGDGRLTYGPEWSLEAWYRIAIGPVGLSFDVARITNPGYNRDRGPMQVLSVRLHAEF